MAKNEEQIGDIRIEDQAIAEFVSEEVLKHKDVSRFSTTFSNVFSVNFWGWETAVPGVKIHNDDNNLTINLHIIVHYGVNIPQLSYDLQMSIKRSVEEFTGMIVKAVNISVEGIDRSNIND